MSQTVTLRSVPPALADSVNLQSLLALLKKLQQLAEPLATADGLRQAIQMLVELGTAAGLNSAWISRLQSLLTDSSAFNTVLSIIAYIESFSSPATTMAGDVKAANADLAIDAQALADWLPLVIQILQLIQSIRGNS
jgi:hypothetical protein